MLIIIYLFNLYKAFKYKQIDNDKSRYLQSQL